MHKNRERRFIPNANLTRAEPSARFESRHRVRGAMNFEIAVAAVVRKLSMTSYGAGGKLWRTAIRERIDNAEEICARGARRIPHPGFLNVARR